MLYHFQVTLSHTFISYSHQLFLSGTSASHVNLVFFHTTIKYFYQNSFITNHHHLLVSLTPTWYSYVTLEQGNNEIYFQLKFSTFTSLRKRNNMYIGSRQFEAIKTFFPLGHILIQGVLNHFGFKSQTRKIVEFPKDSEL